jgi:hypothetical protein
VKHSDINQRNPWGVSVKATLGTLALVLVLLLPAPAAQAANEWFTAEVIETGLSKTGESFIRLTDTAEPPAFSAQWFLLPEKVRKEMLATSLAAVTAMLLLRVRVDLDDLGTPVVKIMYLRNK